MVLTNHALDRLKERLGIKRVAAERLCIKVLELGVQREETDGHLREYLDSIWNKDRIANNIRVYGQHVYIFQDTKLITVWGLPPYYKKLFKLHQQHKGEEMLQTQGQQTEQKTEQPAQIFNQPKVILVPGKRATQQVDIVKLIIALERKHNTNKEEIAKKISCSKTTLFSLLKGEYRSIGPALVGLLNIDPHLQAAANLIISEGDEIAKKSMKKVELTEQLLKLEVQMKQLRREIAASNNQ